HVKCLYPLVIEVDELEIVELLQHEVTRIEQDVRAPMAADRVEEALERDTVVQVLARMDLEADVDARFVERVEDRPPTPRELREAFLDETGGPLRPRIHRVPQERPREGRVRLEPEMRARARRSLELTGRPLAPAARIVAHGRMRERREERRIGRMNGDELALQMRRELRDLDARFAEPSGDVVAVRLALGRALEIEELRIRRRHLHADVAERSCPFRHALE